MGGYVHFLMDGNEFEIYANPAGTTISVAPRRGSRITLLYNIFHMVRPDFIERQLDMHARYQWILAPMARKMEEEASRERYGKLGLPTRIVHSLHVPRVLKNLKHLKMQHKAIGLTESLKIATEGGTRLYRELGLDDLVMPVSEVHALHERIVDARKGIYDLEKHDYDALYF
jgi:hypothetical protein